MNFPLNNSKMNHFLIILMDSDQSFLMYLSQKYISFTTSKLLIFGATSIFPDTCVSGYSSVSFWRSFARTRVEGSFPSAQKCSRWRYRSSKRRSAQAVLLSASWVLCLDISCMPWTLAPALKNLLALKPPLVSSETWSSNKPMWPCGLFIYFQVSHNSHTY